MRSRNIFLSCAVLSAVLSVLSSSAASAQQKTAKERLDEIEKMEVKAEKHRPVHEYETFGVDVLNSFMVGTHLISSDGFGSGFGPCGQFDLGLVDVVARPAHWLSFHLGAGLVWDRYWSRDYVYSIDGSDNVSYRLREEDERGKRKYDSRICTWGAAFPLMAELSSGRFSFRAGVEGLLGANAKTRTRLPSGSSSKTISSKGGIVERLGYDFCASASYCGLGIFVKYRPSSSRVFPEPGPDLGDRWTLGLRLGL